MEERSCGLINTIKKHWFSLGMLMVVALAYFFPSIGQIYVIKKIFSKVAVAIIFLMSGINLRFDELKKGLPRWPIHITVQMFTFIYFPLITFLSVFLAKRYLVTGNSFYEPIFIGIIILGCVPCSSSSAIVWTKAANGSWVIAAFNSIIANLAGLGITPALFYLLLSQKPKTEPLATIRDITVMLIIPMIVGKIFSLVTEKKTPNFYSKLQKVRWGDIEKILLLVIIWISFCDTFTTFKEQQLPVVAIFILIGFFIFLYMFMLGSSFLLAKFSFIAKNRSEALVLIFTNPSKTLSLGIPLILILYKDFPSVGLFQIPLLIYQPIQLTMSGILLGYLKNWRERDPKLSLVDSLQEMADNKKSEDIEMESSDKDIIDSESVNIEGSDNECNNDGECKKMSENSESDNTDATSSGSNEVIDLEDLEVDPNEFENWDSEGENAEEEIIVHIPRSTSSKLSLSRELNDDELNDDNYEDIEDNEDDNKDDMIENNIIINPDTDEIHLDIGDEDIDDDGYEDFNEEDIVVGKHLDMEYDGISSSLKHNKTDTSVEPPTSGIDNEDIKESVI